MKTYLFPLPALALCAPAWAQDSTEDALAEIIGAQDEALDEAGTADNSERIILYHPVVESITVVADGIGSSVRETGQSVTILESEEVLSLQTADPLAALARVPGVTASRSGGVGSLTSVNVRGASADRVLVLVDGVRVADPASPSGGFDFGSVLTGAAARFDILRGGNSTIWGSDALGGVIDITTRNETGLVGSVEYGARDTLFARSSVGVSENGVYVGLTGSWFQTDGFSAAADGEEADGFEQMAIGAVTFVDLTDSLELFAHANFSEGDLEIDGFSFSPPFGLIDSEDTQKTTRHWGDVGFAYYGNDLTLRTSYAVSDTDRTNRSGDGFVTFDSEGQSERLALRGEYRLLGGLSLAFGAEHEWSRFDTNFDEPAKTSNTGAYAQFGGELGDFVAHIGARFDDPEDFGSEASFGADFAYRFADGWRLRGSVGEGYKAPTLYQLFSDFGNGALEPESSTSYDIGVERGSRGRSAHFAVTAFRRDSEDLIGFESCFVTSPPSICGDGRFGFYENTGRARAQGIEVEAGYDLTATLRFSGLYSLVDTEDRETGNELARRPTHSATLFADWESDFGLDLGADLRIVGASFDDGGNVTRLDGYEVVDIRASYDLADGFALFGRIENLFDEEFQTVAGYGTAGRGAFLGVRAQM